MRLRPALVERRDRQRHPERAQIVVVIADAFELCRAQRVRLVEAGAELVLAGKARLLEISGRLEHAEPVAWVFGNSGTATAGSASRTRLRSAGLSSRKTKLSSPRSIASGDRLDVGGLVVPVDPEGDDVVLLQHHLGVIAEGIERDRLRRSSRRRTG